MESGHFEAREAALHWLEKAALGGCADAMVNELASSIMGTAFTWRGGLDWQLTPYVF
jgi:hypothetical protein